MLTGEGQFYTYMVLISETTTQGVNLRWYLDTVGLKKSKAYVANGVVMAIVWLVARIILFIYFFYHLYSHYDQVWLLVSHVLRILSSLLRATCIKLQGRRRRLSITRKINETFVE